MESITGHKNSGDDKNDNRYKYKKRNDGIEKLGSNWGIR